MIQRATEHDTEVLAGLALLLWDNHDVAELRDEFAEMHIEYVFDAMRDNPSDIRNIRAYLLTTLYNATLTIDNYYSAKVNHDLYGVPDSSGMPFFHAQRKGERP